MERPYDYGRLDDGRNCNYWALDPTLRRAAARAYDDEEFDWARPRLDSFGELVGTTIADNADTIDRHPPILHTYDREGNVANDVEYHPKQLENDRLTYETGIVADAFTPPEEREEPVGLAHTLTMQALLSYVDIGFVCPVSMTAGAALVLRNHDDGRLDEYFERLVARDPDEQIEGAMFLTERQGGSDVGANETVAEPADDGTYRLTGEKWFCSNIDAEGTLVLARRPGAPDGTGGLSLFLVPHTKPDGSVNDAVYRRLKDKLGTKSVPTGEVEFDGALGYLVGEPERGFKYMTTMLNYERVTNATGAVGVMGRALLESKVQAATREAFGSPIEEYPLMRRDLVEMAVDYEAAVAFTFEAVRLLDRFERERVRDPDAATDSDLFGLVRLLVPIAKYRTARMAVDTASYAMEIQGGNGYVREFVTHRLFRDAQVLPIWEGASNILALDVLRALERERAHEPLFAALSERLDGLTHPRLVALGDTVRDEVGALQGALGTLAGGDADFAQYHAKSVADFVFEVVTASLLLESAQESLDDGDARDALVARRYVDSRLRESSRNGVTSENRLSDREFDAVVRHATVAPETFTEEVESPDAR
jgi:acyl-CoA dehydrogenase